VLRGIGNVAPISTRQVNVFINRRFLKRMNSGMNPVIRGTANTTNNRFWSAFFARKLNLEKAYEAKEQIGTLIIMAPNAVIKLFTYEYPDTLITS